MLNKKKNIQFFIDIVKKKNESILLIDASTEKKITYFEFFNVS